MAAAGKKAAAAHPAPARGKGVDGARAADSRPAPGKAGERQAPARHRAARAGDAGRPPVAAEAADRARQGAGLPDLRAGERSPALRDRRSGADRRHRQHDQRHGHPGVREGTGYRVAAGDRALRARRRGGDRGSRRRAGRARCRARPHDRPGAHVHARDGHGGAADARGRDPHRQAHRGRPRCRAPRARHVPGRPTTSCCGPTSRSRPARRAWSTSSSASSIRTRPDVIAQPQNPTKMELVAAEEKSEDEEEGEEDGDERGRGSRRHRPGSGRGRHALRLDRQDPRARCSARSRSSAPRIRRRCKPRKKLAGRVHGAASCRRACSMR